MKRKLRLYTLEVSYFRLYMFISTLLILSGYSVYLVFKPDVVSDLGYEDHFFEWVTAISFLLGSIIYLCLYLYSKNIFFLLIAIVLFFGFGEEISWGQRIIKFHTPEAIRMKNVQKEANIHNLELFNRKDLSGRMKTGFQRLLEFNFLFKASTIFLGIILPLLVFHIKTVNRLCTRISLPIPPVSIGVFFGINWVTFRILHVYLLKEGQSLNYYSAANEIYECIGAVIILILSIYFYNERKTIRPGRDVKQTFVDQRLKIGSPDIKASA